MIANFYRKIGAEARLIASKNIDCVPQKGICIKISGQLFAIDKVCFNVDTCEYDFYIVRT